MKLISFSVQNYRSIIKANKIEVGPFTVLVGPNNEGKSNVLRALVTAMEILTSARPISVHGQMIYGRMHNFRRYVWDRDFPILLQRKSPGGESVFILEFEPTNEELEQFRQEIKSNLTGTLPVQLSVGQKGVTFAVHKKGPGSKKLSKKAGAIAYFVAQHIEFQYIEAIRTAKSAQKVVDTLLEKELTAVESAPEFTQALAKVQELQQPILDQLSASIKTTMGKFLPAIKNVRVEIATEERFAALRRSAKVIVDDGTPTQLQYKGDGVQSLAALALIASESASKGKNFVIAIEEPESHLHPKAMHELRAVLVELAQKYQVVITTHSPLFVDRTNVKANVLVHKNKAISATSIEQIRTILGVKASDNMRHAVLVLIVEGEDDKKALSALLAANSAVLKENLSNGRLAIQTLGGAMNLAYVSCLVKDTLLCACHAFLDNDQSGRAAFEKAKTEGVLAIADVNFAAAPGMKESELEDMYDFHFYKDLVWNAYAVSLDTPKFKANKKKWKERVRNAFESAGKPWDDKVELEIKIKVACLVETNPTDALATGKRAAFDNLVESLTAHLAYLPVG